MSVGKFTPTIQVVLFFQRKEMQTNAHFLFKKC